MSLSTKTLLSGLHIPQEGEKNSLDTRVKQRELATGDRGAGMAPSIGGTEAPGDESVSTFKSSKSAVSKFSQKVISVLLVNLPMEERLGFMEAQGLNLSDYEIFIPGEESPQDHLGDESLSNEEQDEE